jgi:signal transduction histidine kinase
VITVTGAGDIVASTVDDQQARALLAAAGGSASVQAALRAETPTAEVTERDCAGVPCYIAVRRTSTRSDTAVAVVIRTAELRSATAAITRAVVVSAAVALIVMLMVSQFVARRVTAPIDELVAFTRDATPGGAHRRARAGPDEVGRLAAAFNDMLDRLDRAQDALVQSEKLAVAGLLAARVAHDIRNPLSSIKMQTQLLRARTLDSTERPLVDSVLHDVDQVESVIRGLLELARPGELKLAAASLNELIALLQRLRPQFAHRKVVVVTRFDDSIPVMELDPARFEQALLNVVLNGAEAMPYGGTLTVVTRMEAAGTHARIEICDDGVGISPEVADRLFDPFVSSKRDGVGLGLVNTKAVVESHGGRIVVVPNSPKGTIVRIDVPIRRSLSKSDAQTSHG